MTKDTILGQGHYLTLVNRDNWEFVIRHRATGVVILVAATDDGEVVLVEQFRRPVNSRVIELPAGLVGDESDASENRLEAARRELLEETGYSAQRFEALTEGPSSPGLAAETVTFVKATGLQREHEGGGVEGEDITVHLVPRTHVPEFLKRRQAEGVMVDAKVFTGLYFLDQSAS